MSVVNQTSFGQVKGMEDLYKPDILRRPNNEMGKDAFLMLLVTQLQNQDPLEPKSDTDFIAQMAQFSALEAMTNLNTAFMQTQAYSLIGKGVYAVTSAAGRLIETVGVVESAGVDKDGKIYVVLDNDRQVFAEDIKQVFDAGSLINTNKLVEISSTLIGQLVTATYPLPVEKKDEETPGLVLPPLPPEYVTVTGIVTKVEADEKDGQIYLFLEDADGKVTRVNMAYIVAIAPPPVVNTEEPEEGTIPPWLHLIIAAILASQAGNDKKEEPAAVSPDSEADPDPEPDLADPAP